MSSRGCGPKRQDATRCATHCESIVALIEGREQHKRVGNGLWRSVWMDGKGWDGMGRTDVVNGRNVRVVSMCQYV